MGSLVRFIMRSRMHAVAVAVLGMLVPPFAFFSGAIVGLTGLRRGLADSALVLAAAIAVPFVAMALWSLAYQPVIVFILLSAIPLVFLAQVLRQTASEGIVLTAAGAMGAVTLAAIHLSARDPVAWLGGKLDSLLVQPMRESRPDAPPESMELLGRIVEQMSAPGVLVIGFMMIALLMLWVARWMQAFVDNPGGFGREFRELRLDRRVAYASVVVALLALLAGRFANGLFLAWFAIAINMYTIQGIALVHAVVHQRGASSGWLVLMYIGMMIIAPIVSLGLALAGFSDTWFDFRRRLGAGT